MTWGGANRPKITTKLGYPHRSEGIDGDTQIKGTPLGAKLFTKWSGRWWDIALSIDGVTKFGTTDSDYLSIDRDSVDIYKNSVKVAEFGSTVIIGEVGASKSNVQITSGAINLRSNTTTKITLDTNGDIKLSGNIICGKTDGTFNATDNIMIGMGGQSTDGLQNVCIGYLAGKELDALTATNTLVGYQAGKNVRDSAASNVCLGQNAGDGITTGSYNICIGSVADGAATLDEQIAIGVATVCDTAETIRIGDSANYMFFDFASSGAVTVTSDERVKKDIINTDIGLDFINALRPIKYTPKEKHEYPDELFQNGVNEVKEGDKATIGSKRMEGFLAQEVKQAMDGLGVTFSGWHQNNSSRQMLGYSTFVVPLTKAVQELSAKIDTMQTEINNLK